MDFRVGSLPLIIALLAAVPFASATVGADEPDEAPEAQAAPAFPEGDAAQIRALQQRMQAVQRELAEMQAELSRLRVGQPPADPDPPPAGEGDEPSEPTATLATAPPEQTTADQEIADWRTLDQRISSLENVTGEWLRQIKLGGAVRLNYAWRSYDEQSRDRLGDFELELLRVNAGGRIGDVELNAEWRRYNDFQAVHHAWVGYEFSDSLSAEAGITQVPFGILPFASHSFWFSGAYYLGLEDDYDTGIKFVHRPREDWTFHYAYFKNPEYANDERVNRYSFDLVTAGDQQNSEVDQFNVRAERRATFADDGVVDLGISLQGGRIFNRLTGDDGERYALAAHADVHLADWNAQLQAVRYEFDPANPAGVDDDFVQLGAFGFPFLAAARADVYTVNLARRFELALGPITGGTCYNDLTWIRARVADGADSVQNVTGCSLVAGGVFAYFDWINGKNMWFIGGDGIGRDATTADEWRSRINVNLGFYF